MFVFTLIGLAVVIGLACFGAFALFVGLMR